jgi:acyl carrier protein
LEKSLDNDFLSELKSIVVNTIGGDIPADQMPDDYQLAGNALDSMAVTNLILAIEEYYDISFNDEDLSVEAFQNIISLATLVENKLQK